MEISNGWLVEGSSHIFTVCVVDYFCFTRVWLWFILLYHISLCQTWWRNCERNARRTMRFKELWTPEALNHQLTMTLAENTILLMEEIRRSPPGMYKDPLNNERNVGDFWTMSSSEEKILGCKESNLLKIAHHACTTCTNANPAHTVIEWFFPATSLSSMILISGGKAPTEMTKKSLTPQALLNDSPFTIYSRKVSGNSPSQPRPEDGCCRESIQNHGPKILMSTNG